MTFADTFGIAEFAFRRYLNAAVTSVIGVTIVMYAMNTGSA